MQGHLTGNAPQINTETGTCSAGLQANLQRGGQIKLVKSVETLEGAERISIKV